MKQVLKVILICFVCVIGAFGLAIGGMYLFGGFDEKIVYADNLSFSQTEVISSKKILLQLNTTTEGVTRKKVKLYPSSGGKDIIEFPDYVNIGETFTVLPKINDNGTNIGGNVTLYAEYDTVDANLSAKAKCEILIDIPVEEVTINIDNLVMKPNIEQIICNEGDLLSSTLNISPTDSLVPYLSKGTLKIGNIVNKALYLELVDDEGNSFENSTSTVEFYVGTDKLEATGKTFIPVEYNLTANGAVFAKSIAIKPKSNQEDFYLKAYVYSTYAEQQKNIDEQTGVQFNKYSTITKDLGFTIGAYDVNGMTIKPTNQNVYLYEDTNIYLNNPNVKGNDIDLGIELSTSSPGIEEVGKSYYLDYIYLNINNNTYRTLTNANSDLESDISTQNGLPIKYNGISTQKDEWLWKFKIDDFFAYYDYETSDKVFTATVTYKDNQNTHIRTFNIIPKIHEVDSLSVVYSKEGDTSLNVQSNKNVAVTKNNININYNLPVGKEPTFDELAYYISYDKNFDNGKTTVSTIPSEKGVYKVNFSFILTEESSISTIVTSSTWGIFQNVKFSQGDKNLEIQYENGSVKQPVNSKLFSANTPIYVEAIVKLNSTIESNDIFYINDYIKITNTDVKFYKGLGENSYETYPHLTIDSVRYYINFDYYLHEETNVQYLKIDTQNSEFRVQGIGEFFVTAQLIYFDQDTEKTFWLGKSADVKVDVYERLSNLSAYSLTDIENSTYGVFENVISYSEDNKDTYYILITSTEIDSLKNYIYYNQVNVSVKQIIDEDLISKYSGIDTINNEAIIFVGSWVEVIKDEVLVGYRLAYKINPIYTLEVDEGVIANNFEIVISIMVNGTEVKADFHKAAVGEGEEIKKSLEFEIVDKTVKGAVIKYSTPSGVTNDGSSEEQALELYASVNGADITWNVNFTENLRYYFKYNETDSTGIITSMTSSVQALNVTGLPVSELVNFSIDTNNYIESEKVGKGGLTLKNFPTNPDEDGKNQGILLRVTVYASDIPYDFNSRYKWSNTENKFVLTKNENLFAYLYLKVYGLDIEISSNEKEIYACGNSEVDLIGNDGLFNISVKSGSANKSGTVYNSITDFSNIFKTNVVKNSLATDESVVVSDDLTKLKIRDDFMVDGEQIFYFYVGNVQSGRIKIKTGVDGEGKDVLENSYTQHLKSAFTINTNSTFEAPSKDNNFVTIGYNLPGSPLTAEDLVTVNVNVKSHSLDNKYGITNPIKVNEDKTLSFKTVPVSYTAVIELNIIKIGNSDDFITLDYNISINTIYTNNDIVVGNLFDDGEGNTYYYLTAGKENPISVGSGISYQNKLAENIAEAGPNFQYPKPTGVTITFENAQEDYIVASEHMNKDAYVNRMAIWSDDLNYSKDVNITITFTFDDDGKIICYKTIKVLPNLTLSLLKTTYKSGDTINLTDDESAYVFTKNSARVKLDLSSFKYDGIENKAYNKDSFTYDNTFFTDESNMVNFENLRLKVKNPEFTAQVTTIVFEYIIPSEDYRLYFDIQVNIQPIIYSDDLSFGLFHEATGEGGDNVDYYYVQAGQENALTVNNGITYLDNLLLANNAGKIARVDAVFENVDSLDTLEANKHMFVSGIGSNISIYSTDLNYTKDVKVTLTFVFADNTTFEFESVLKVLPNLTLAFTKEDILKTERIDLLNENSYVLTRNGVAGILEIPNFNYEGNGTVYSKDNFIYDETFFGRYDVDNDNALVLTIIDDTTPEGEVVNKVITLIYVATNTKGENYNLTFELNVSVEF